MNDGSLHAKVKLVYCLKGQGVIVYKCVLSALTAVCYDNSGQTEMDRKPRAKFENCPKWDTLQFNRPTLEPEKRVQVHIFAPRCRVPLEHQFFWHLKTNFVFWQRHQGMPVAIPTIIPVVATSAPAGNIGCPLWSVVRRAIVLFFFFLNIHKAKLKKYNIKWAKVQHRWFHIHLNQETLTSEPTSWSTNHILWS